MQWYCHKLHWSEQWYIKRRIPSHNVITHYSTAKRLKQSLILEKCVIWQKSSIETVVLLTDNSKSRCFFLL